MIETIDRVGLPEPELVLEPKFDAALVHGYWMSEPKPGDVRLALRSRLAVRAGALALDEAWGAKQIVLPLGKLWGENYKSEGNLMADELENKYFVLPRAVIREGDAYSTVGEIKTFLEIAKKNGWTRLLDIAFSEHFLTIPKIYNAYNKNHVSVEHMSVEEIIAQEDDPLVDRLVKRLNKSRYGFVYKFIYEPGKRFKMSRRGFDFETMEEQNRDERKEKGADSPLSRKLSRWLDIDVYKL